MSIKVRYFASLKESLGQSEDELEFVEVIAVIDVWLQANPGIELPANIIAAVNMEYVALDSLVNNDDEVAFFPPVTGG